MVTCFESQREEEMKRYLLYPKQRAEIAKGRFWLVRNPLTELWRFVKDKYFLCVHFRFNSDSLLESIGESPSQQDVLRFVE